MLKEVKGSLEELNFPFYLIKIIVPFLAIVLPI